jgi:chemotaxis protein CheY-P-specific phosphatase CheC
MISLITELFLGEEESDEETQNDMALETTNLIVGSAKVLAEELNEQPFTIQTPHFVKRDLFDLECDVFKTVAIDGRQMMIGIKEQ